MTRKFLAAAISGVAMWAAGAENPKMNVLFIGFDDLRPLLGCYGDPIAKTPNLDRFAERAMVFRNAHVQQAVCSASRASFLTGCRPDTVGVDYPYSRYFMNEFMPKHPTLQKHFMNEGWFAQAIGKLHHGCAEHLSVPSNSLWGRHYIAPGNKRRPQKECDPFEHPDVEDTAYSDGDIARLSVEMLRTHGKDGQPFFLATGFYKPHLPWSCPKKYYDLYKTGDMPLAAVPGLPEGGFAHTVAHYALAKYAGENDESGKRIPDDRARQLIHSYYACVSYVDAQFGKVIDELDKQGLMDSTIIVVWSDHGYHLGDQSGWGKTTNFKYSTHVPLMAYAPGMKTAGHQTDALVEYVDLYPTILELAGLELPDYLEGTSMVPLLENPSKPWKTAAFFQFPRWGQEVGHVEGFGMQTERYRYIEWREREKGGPIGEVKVRELYDHTKTPLEAVNLIDHPEYKAVVAKLETQLSKGWKNALPPGIENFSDNPPAPPFVKWSGSGEKNAGKGSKGSGGKKIETSENKPWIKRFFEENPAADADGDGILSKEEVNRFKARK